LEKREEAQKDQELQKKLPSLKKEYQRRIKSGTRVTKRRSGEPQHPGKMGQGTTTGLG